MRYIVLILALYLAACGNAGTGQRGEEISEGGWSYKTTPTPLPVATATPAPTATAVPQAAPTCPPQILPTPEFCLAHPTTGIVSTRIFTQEVESGQQARYLEVTLDSGEIGPEHFTMELTGSTGSVYLPLPGEHEPGVFTFRVPLDEDAYSAHILWRVNEVTVP